MGLGAFVTTLALPREPSAYRARMYETVARKTRYAKLQAILKDYLQEERCRRGVVWSYWAAWKGIRFLDANLLDDVVTEEENLEGECNAEMDHSDYRNE